MADELAGFRGRMRLEEERIKERYSMFSEFDVEDVYKAVQDLHEEDLTLFLYLAPETFSSYILENMDPVKSIEQCKLMAGLKFYPDHAERIYTEVAEKLAKTDHVYVDGVGRVGILLSHMSEPSRTVILENLEEDDPELVDQIRTKMEAKGGEKES